MRITKNQIESMNEATLRRRILIPLFRKMQFQDVFEYHGGAGEQGKDIVMWKSDELLSRVNHAVVVKATRISGKAAGKSSAAEVRFQIEQCLGAPYRDPITGQHCIVQRCWVVTSRAIGKEALESLSSTLSASRADRIVEYIDGAKLWELVEKYLPELSVQDKIAEIEAMLIDTDPDYGLILQTGMGGTTIRITPKHTDARPLAINAIFGFPDTDDGRAARAKFEAYFKTGAPVVLTKPYIIKLHTPPLLKAFLGSEGENVGEIRIGPRQAAKARVVDLVVKPTQGDPIAITHVELRATQIGSEQITFASENEFSPWKFLFHMNRTTGEFNLTFSANYAEANVKEELNGLRFQRALSVGGKLRFLDCRTGLSLGEATVPAGVVHAPLEEWLLLLNALSMIQEKAATPLIVRERSLGPDEVATILKVAEIMDTGRLTHHVASFRFRAGLELARNILDRCPPGKAVSVAHDSEEQVTILGETITLGRVIRMFNAAYLDTTMHEDVLRFVAAGLQEPSLEITFRVTENSPQEIYYVRFMPPEEARELNTRFAAAKEPVGIDTIEDVSR
jgi:hypothetical protein